MRLSKFLLVMSFITLIALIYVYQQTQIFYLAYLGGKRQVVLADLLDKNNIFRYNINKLSSLPYLDTKIMHNIDFEIPARKQLVRVKVKQANTQVSRAPNKRTNLFFSFFGTVKQAQAQPLNRFPPQ